MDKLAVDRARLYDALEIARWEAEYVSRFVGIIDDGLPDEARELLENIRACQDRRIRNLTRLCFLSPE